MQLSHTTVYFSYSAFAGGEFLKPNWNIAVEELYVNGRAALNRPLELNTNLISDLSSCRRHPGCVE